MVGLFIPCPHGDWKLACTMCDNALKNWSVFKTLQCFKILNCFQNTSVFEYLVTLSARKWLLFCGFLKLSSPLNALLHMMPAYKCSIGESLILHWTNFVSVSASARKMIGLFLLCCHADCMLAGTMCDMWQCIKKLSVFQNTKVFPKHFSFLMPFHIECKKIGILLCGFFKLPSTCNPLSHVVQASF